jgi:hypothetical protein
MIIDSDLSPEKLNDAVHDTIRVFDNYGLAIRQDKEGRFRINDFSPMGTYSSYYTYYINPTEKGSEMILESFKVGGKPYPLEKQEAYEKAFLKNLNKIIDKEIPITAEIANKNIYKAEKGVKGIGIIISVIFIILLLYFGMKLLMQ